MHHVIFKSLCLALAFAPACAASGADTKRVAAMPTSPSDASLSASGLGPKPSAEAYTAKWQATLAQLQKQLAALEAQEAPFDEARVLKPLDSLYQGVDKTLGEAGLVRNVSPDASVRQAAEACEQAFSAFVTNVSLSRALFERVSGVDSGPLAADTRHWVTRLVRDFKRAGVDRDEATRSRIRALQEELVQTGQAFDRNIREDVRTLKVAPEALLGLPEDYIQAHPKDADGKVKLTTDYPDYVPFMTYARDDQERRAFYTLFRQRGFPSNEAVLKRLLTLRHELAGLLGHASWADYITQDKMIGSAKNAQAFIDRIDALAKPRAQRDYDALLAQLKKTHPAAKHVADWQKAFVEEELKREHYHFDSQALREFLPFGRVQDGVLSTMGELFGVRFVRDDKRAVWHPDVTAWRMEDLHGALVGRFFLDLHPRADKYKHAAAFPIVSGLLGTQLPEAALVCNFPQGEDALMGHDDVETFFHEFGHLMHHLFAGQQRWVGLSGIATEWDFVEAPSQLLEEWAFDSAILKRMAKRADGASLDDELIAALKRVRSLGRGLWVRHQMFYAATSLTYHLIDPTGPKLKNTDDVLRALQARYSPFSFVDGTHFQLSFGHLEGYSAIYYTYMWSLVIAKDLLGAFLDGQGLADTQMAHKYRDTVLKPGGSKEAHTLVHDFLGRDFRFDAFAHWVDSER